MWAARAAIAGGLDGTSNVLAALKLGRKPSGTMAHALVMAIGAMAGGEDEAFTAFSRYFPQAPLLIDTYDTMAAASRLAEEVKAGKRDLTGIRLDSGDLVTLSQKVRSLLPEVAIFASGDLDEWKIAQIREAGACIDGYGLGTKLVTGAPVNGVYKLVEIDGIPTSKKSLNKSTYPGKKQIFRQYKGSKFVEDRLGLVEEVPQAGEESLLRLVMKEGKYCCEVGSLETISKRSANSVASLPNSTVQISEPGSYNVEISQRLKELAKA